MMDTSPISRMVCGSGQPRQTAVTMPVASRATPVPSPRLSRNTPLIRVRVVTPNRLSTMMRPYTLSWQIIVAKSALHRSDTGL